MKKIIALIILIHTAFLVNAQQLPNFNHYFVVPYLTNPAQLGQSGYSELSLIHRQQFVGINEAPVSTNLNFQMPLDASSAVGVNLSNTEQGAFTLSIAEGAYSYTLKLNNRNSFLSFGLVAGVGRNSFDVSKSGNPDPAIIGQLDKSFFMRGQFGTSLQLNRLNIGFSLPQIFGSQGLSDKDFQDIEFVPLSTSIAQVGYEFSISPDVLIKPTALYRTYEVTGGEYEINTTAYLKDLVWLGGTYRQSSGIAANAGIIVNSKFKVGYSYELGKSILPSTHEFKLGLRIGNVNKRNAPSDDIASEEEPDSIITEEEIIETVKTEESNELAETDVAKNEPSKKERKNQELAISEPVVEDSKSQALPIKDENIDASQSENNEIAKSDNSPVEPAENDLVKPVNDLAKQQKAAPEIKPSTDTRTYGFDPATELSVTQKLSTQKKKSIAAQQKNVLLKKEVTETANVENTKVVHIDQHVSDDGMSPGYYVVVGSFTQLSNAAGFIQTLSNEGHQSKKGYSGTTGFNYVYVFFTPNSVNEAAAIRDKYRAIDLYSLPDTWILKIN